MEKSKHDIWIENYRKCNRISNFYKTCAIINGLVFLFIIIAMSDGGLFPIGFLILLFNIVIHIICYKEADYYDRKSFGWK